jgi:hypothetical protein
MQQMKLAPRDKLALTTKRLRFLKKLAHNRIALHGSALLPIGVYQNPVWLCIRSIDGRNVGHIPFQRDAAILADKL